MRNNTPFLKAFGPLLFGKPPTSALTEALTKLAECSSLCQLRKVFGPYIAQGLLGTKSSGDNSRRRIFSLDVTFWSFFDQVQTPGCSCREAVRKVIAFTRRMLPREKDIGISVNTAAFCKARAKLPLEVLNKINTHLVDRLQRHIPSRDLWHGRHIRTVDGTGVSMPDTPANQERWPQSKGQKPGCGFPSMNLVGLFCLVTGALIKVAYGNRHSHESKLFQSLYDTLNPDDVLVADRGFCSFAAFAGLIARSVDPLMRLPENKIRKAIGAKLPKSDNFDVIITWDRPAQRPKWMTREEFVLLPKSILVRVVRYTIAQRGFRSQRVTLVTTLLDASIPANDLAELYFRRWDVELHFREIKIHLNMDVLRCLSPHMIKRELRMHFIAYNLIRCVMQTSALTHNVDSRRLSFKGSLDTVRQFANACAGADHKPRTISMLVDQMLLSIAQDPVPDRPDRSEPRVKKRRPKNYRLLTKPRSEMGPLPHRKVGRENHPKQPLS